MNNLECDLTNLLFAMTPDVRDDVMPRAVARDDVDGGTKASHPAMAVDRRKRRAALVVFIAAVFPLVSNR